MENRNERNKVLVREFYHLAMNLRSPEEAAARYLGPFYKQHNPGAADGDQAFVRYAREFLKTYPALTFQFRRFIAEGDLVSVHSHLVRHAGDRGVAIMDIFRVENDLIVEHWDVIQEIPTTTANNNTMF